MDMLGSNGSESEFRLTKVSCSWVRGIDVLQIQMPIFRHLLDPCLHVKAMEVLTQLRCWHSPRLSHQCMLSCVLSAV